GDGDFALAISGIDSTDRVDGPPPLAMDPSRPDRLYFGTFRVYQSIDGAQSWAAISPDLTLNNTSGSVLSAIAVAPTDSNTVYAASFEGHVQLTTTAHRHRADPDAH